MGKIPEPKKYYEPPKEDTMMVSSLGTGMSGLSFNDWDDPVPSKAKKFSSHDYDFENTYDDRELTGKGTYDLENEREEELGEVVLEYTRMLTGKIQIPEETKEPPMSPITEKSDDFESTWDINPKAAKLAHMETKKR